MRSTHICFQPSFDDVTRYNFRFRLLVTWSSPRRRGASSDIIWCKISLSSPKLLTFVRNSRWRPPPSWIFSLCEFGHSSVLVVWYLCSVPNLVQISVIVTEHICFRHSFDDVTRINFRFRILVTWSLVLIEPVAELGLSGGSHGQSSSPFPLSYLFASVPLWSTHNSPFHFVFP